jgi:hypothetical protein
MELDATSPLRLLARSVGVGCRLLISTIALPHPRASPTHSTPRLAAILEISKLELCT